MKTLFAKYNSERLPKYQIVTKIVQDLNGKRFAVKEPLADEAKAHIDAIFHNYELLTSRYNINLVQPTKQDHAIVFEMAEGVSLEKLMLQAIHDGNVKLFERYVEKFVAYVDQFVSHKNVLFESSDQFKAVFGEWTIDKPQDIIDLANIDLIFGNIFVNEKDDFSLIDYEWVFEFSIPKSYIIWRAFYIFSIYHNVEIDTYNLKQFFEYHDDLSKLDEQFSSFVHGKNKEHFLNQKVLKANIQQTISINQADSFIQLFLDQGNGITEENSLKLPVINNTEIQEFIFNLTDKPNITALRLDPLNDACVIEIESLRLIKEDSAIDLTSFLQANDCIHQGKSYFFDTIDPIIHLHSIDCSNAQKLVALIRYPHIGRDALEVTAKQTKTELDQILSSQSWKITKPLRIMKQILQGNS